MKTLIPAVVAVVAAVAAVSLALAAPAIAAPPPNDAFADATTITALPYTDAQQSTEATTEFGEPQNCSFSPQTVWYRITPTADGVLGADVGGSTVPATLSLYRDGGSGISSLSFVGCASFGPSSSTTAHVQAGVTYYLQAGALFSVGFGTIRLSVQPLTPPANDDFATATAADTLPFADQVDTIAAGVEAGEPTPACAGALGTSVWYAYHAAATGSVTATISAGFGSSLAAYTGSTVASLQQIGCRSNFGSVLTFRAEAGQTYYLQLGRSQFSCCGTSASFSLDVAPSPVAAFGVYPGDPNTYDTVVFSDQSYDAGQAAFVGQQFDFGDGTSADGCCSATHRYANDGDYTVSDTVTTEDGRSASTTQTLHVRTHDATITKLTVPQSASAGQTRSLAVGISNTRYPETVTVELQRSAAGSAAFVTVGTLTQEVPVRSANRTTPFAYSYTFTAEDAAAGKVTFRAVATIVGARDALPADNTVVALPTKVGR